MGVFGCAVSVCGHCLYCLWFLAAAVGFGARVVALRYDWLVGICVCCRTYCLMFGFWWRWVL